MNVYLFTQQGTEMKKFNVVYYVTLKRYWDDIEAEDRFDALHKTVHMDAPPDHEKIISAESDVDEVE